MKDEIQKLIQWAEVRQKAYSACTKVFITDKAKFKAEGNLAECDFWIEQLKLLLKDESKQPKPPDFANTTFSEVPQVVSVENQESQQAVEGATPVVQQNEQTKEVCQIGKFQWEIPHCNMLPCQNCPHFS